jgi:DNA-binding IclR family transcriptional regulator
MREQRDDRPNDLVRSVSRAMRVLEEVGRGAAPLTVKAIARRSRLNLSTTYHLVRTLAYEGYLERHHDGRYALGRAVADRFHDLVESFGQPPEVRTVLRHLSAATGRTAYLGRFVGGHIRITDLVEGPGSPYLEDLEVGLDVSAHATAVGKALLSSMPRSRRATYLKDQGLRRFTQRTIIEVDRLEAELTAIEPGRPVVEHEQFRDGVSCVAALVRRQAPSDPWWAIVVSTRADVVPPPVVSQTLLAATDLGSAA